MRLLTQATLAAALLASPLLAHPASAAAITYDLNTVINGTLSPTASYGTVTFADGKSNANTIDVTVALNGAGWKVQEFIFNYNDTKFSASTSFVLTGDVTSYKISENDTKAGGYSTGKFDVQTPATGNIGTQPINFNIALAGTNLSPGDFDFLDTSGKLFNAVHIGNCGTTTCSPTGGTGSASIWVGAGNPGTTIPGTGTPVPEPASMALIGAGLVGLGIVRRRGKKA